MNADDDISFYSVNRDPNGAVIRLADSQQRHNDLMSPHIRRMKEVKAALKRVPTAHTNLKRKAYKCDPTILPFASETEQIRSEEGYTRLLENFDKHHVQRTRKRNHSSVQIRASTEMLDDGPKEATLLFEKFQATYPIRAINEKEYINPSYYDTSGFNVRAAHAKPSEAEVDYNRMLLSAFNNPKTQVVLKKSSNDNKHNIYMNTRSFAAKYGRMAPKHKVKQISKAYDDMPQVGYYDVKTTLQDRRVQSVRMDAYLPRDSTMLKGGKAPDPNQWKALDDKSVQNYWTKKHIPNMHMDYNN